MKQKKLNLPWGVLKVKKGYNPNSSSIGTAVYSLPNAFIAVSAIFAVLTVFFNKQSTPGDSENKDKKDE